MRAARAPTCLGEFGGDGPAFGRRTRDDGDEPGQARCAGVVDDAGDGCTGGGAHDGGGGAEDIAGDDRFAAGPIGGVRPVWRIGQVGHFALQVGRARAEDDG